MGTNRLRGADTDPHIGARRAMRESVVVAAQTGPAAVEAFETVMSYRDPDMPTEWIVVVPEAVGPIELGTRASSVRIVAVEGSDAVDELCRVGLALAGGDLVDLVVAGRRPAPALDRGWAEALAAAGVARA